jgi:hypothetical protein
MLEETSFRIRPICWYSPIYSTLELIVDQSEAVVFYKTAYNSVRSEVVCT